MKACEVIVQERTKQLDDCKAELVRKLKAAIKQEEKIGKLADESLFEEYVRVSRTEGVGDDKATKIVSDLLDDAGAKVKDKNKSDAKGRPTAKGKGKGKADDGLTEKQKEAIWEHREATHEIRRITKELVGRVRSLRYFTVVRDLQKQQDTPPTVSCPTCGRDKVPMEEVAVLSSCGHTGCFTCVMQCAEREECVYAASGVCKAAARVLNVVRGDTLGVDDVARDKNAKHFGTKLEKVMELIKYVSFLTSPYANADPFPSKRIKKQRVLIFVQFPDLMKKVGEALDANNIKYLEIKGSASQRSKNLEKYQNDTAERVLLLNVMDESASGANLTGANHAVFLSPLLAPSQEIYDACETQAIGRLRRYGQNEHVHIWRFLSTNTIDTQIYQERTGKQVV